MSTLIDSPGFTNSGTWTTRPVSSVAGLRAPETRSPWTPGSVSATDELDRGGQVDADDLVVVELDDRLAALAQVVRRVARGVAGPTESWS